MRISLLSRSALGLVMLCGLQLVAPAASALQVIAGQPRDSGDLVCKDIPIDQIAPGKVKTVCRYLPVNDTAANIQAGLLRVFFGGRQPSNPDEAHIRTLPNGQLEIAHTEKALIQALLAELPDLDMLDPYNKKRKVNIIVQVYQTNQGSDDSSGFMLGAQYSGRNRNAVPEQDRFVTGTAGGLLNFNFNFGNLLNSVLNLSLTKYTSTNDIKVLSSVPIELTHGYSLSNVLAYSKPIYIQTTSVEAKTEQEGIRFEGQARFHEGLKNKITINDFSISVSQYEPGKTKREGAVEGVETFKSPVRNLELEIGCSTVIRVINVSRKGKEKERNFFASSKTETVDSKKEFLFVVQAQEDNRGTEASSACENTGALPESVEKR